MLVGGKPLNPITAGSTQNALVQVIPASMRWSSIRSGIAIHRDRYKLDSLQSEYATTTNRIIKFELPNQNFIDFRRGGLDVNVTITTTGGTYKRLAQFATSLFSRFTIRTGVEIEDIKEYNLLTSILQTTAVESDVHETVGNALLGFGTQAERNAWGAVQTQYIIPVFSSFLNTGLIPISFIRDKVCVEFYIADAINIVETDGTNPIVTITDAELHYDIVVADDSYTNQVATQLRTTGLNLGAKTWEHYANTFNSARATVNINHRSDSVEDIVSTMRTDSTLQNPLINDKMMNWYRFGLTQYSLKINSVIIPQEPIDTTGRAVEAYLEYLKWLGKWHIHGVYKNPPNITGNNFTLDKFLIVNELTQHPGEMNLVNPVGTKHISSTLFMDLLLSAPPPSTVRIDSFVEYYITYNINTSGKLSRHF